MLQEMQRCHERELRDFEEKSLDGERLFEGNGEKVPTEPYKCNSCQVAATVAGRATIGFTMHSVHICTFEGPASAVSPLLLSPWRCVHHLGLC